jgi:hypothetical protein
MKTEQHIDVMKCHSPKTSSSSGNRQVNTEQSKNRNYLIFSLDIVQVHKFCEDNQSASGTDWRSLPKK